jgi:putative Holliday junction resolvase
LRVIGLDYGTKTVGVALSDETGLIAQPYETITRKHASKLRQTYARIEELISEYGVETIVLGLPKNMNNTEGERAEDTRAFMSDLERRTGLPVVLVDERLTTVEAERILDAGGVRRSEQKTYVDKMAAAIILQSYLDSQPHTVEKE